jgi:hydroxymethylbilane synthase
VAQNSIATRSILVGTRESKLARLQTDIVIERLQKAQPQLKFEIVPITTGGDKILHKPIAEIGTRGVFVKELEEALFQKSVDFVVHSLKDLPTEVPAGLALACVLDRADTRDVLVSKDKIPFLKLPAGARVATSSRRRTAQLRALRNDLEFVDIRGNIPTRLRKHDEGHCEAMVLAAAGLLRLDLRERITEFFDADICTPAVGQGALAVECRADDKDILALLDALEAKDVRAQIDSERALLEALGGGCAVPIGGLAQAAPDGKLKLTGCVASVDGVKVIRTSLVADAKEAKKLGQDVAHKLQELGAAEILSVYLEEPPATPSPP